MAEQFAGKVVAQFTGEIALRLNKASALATAAESLSSQGLTQHAFPTLLDVEPLIFWSHNAAECSFDREPWGQ
jgi:hypothetical protein